MRVCVCVCVCVRERESVCAFLVAAEPKGQLPRDPKGSHTHTHIHTHPDTHTGLFL